MMLTIVSSRKAEKRNSPHEARNHGRGKAYLALLSMGPRDTIKRTFVQRAKSQRESELIFRVAAKPGDIYEARRWYWDAARETFMGGVVYLGIDRDGSAFPLTRDEAFASVLRPPVHHERADTSVPAIVYAERVMPHGVYSS